jgi:CheY-like chemotaxis protein
MPNAAFTVLVVEPDGEERARLFALFRELGCDVLGCGSGRDALRAVALSRPDAVLSEASLLDLAWPEFLRRIRTLSPGTGVFFMSPEPARGEYLAMLAEGALDLLPRPVRREDLQASRAREAWPIGPTIGEVDSEC